MNQNRRQRIDALFEAALKGVVGSRIVKRWKAEGRGAGCYNTVAMLVKAKKLERRPIAGKKRGSLYVVG